MVYDVCSAESFVNVKRWLYEIDQNCEDVSRILGKYGCVLGRLPGNCAMPPTLRFFQICITSRETNRRGCRARESLQKFHGRTEKGKWQDMGSID